jgi:hypothetical protein
METLASQQVCRWRDMYEQVIVTSAHELMTRLIICCCISGGSDVMTGTFADFNNTNRLGVCVKSEMFIKGGN